MDELIERVMVGGVIAVTLTMMALFFALVIGLVVAGVLYVL